MPNETQIECYFKSADMAALCQGTTDIVINFKASYPPDSPPTFEITADGFTEGVSAAKSITSTAAPTSNPPVGGCPKPC